MKKILLLRAMARLSLSIATAFLVMSALGLWAGWHGDMSGNWYEQWREKVEDYRVDRDWASSDRPQLCAQIRSGTLSPREALAKIGETPPRVNPPGCDLESNERLGPWGRVYWNFSGKKECEQLARKHDPEEWLALSRVGCVDPYSERGYRDGPKLADPGSFPRYLLEEQIKSNIAVILLGLFAISLGTFLLLSSGRLFLTEAHLGWRRVSLLLGAVALLVVPLGFVLAEGSSIAWNEAVLVTAVLGLATFPLAILLVLGGRRIVAWVAAGFSSGTTGTERETSTVAAVNPRTTAAAAQGTVLRSEPVQPGYLSRHLRGDFGLGVSFWLNNVLLTVIVMLISVAVLRSLMSDPRAFAVASVVSYAALIALSVWQFVGVWRSAGKHVERGGAAFWASTAQVVTGLWAVSMVVSFLYTLPATTQSMRIALGLA